MLRKLFGLWGKLPLSGRMRWWMVYPALQKFPVGVVGVIVNKNGHVLLFKHTYRGEFPWGLPAGWLKPGETPENAIKREIEEETGFVVDDPDLLLADSAPDARRVDLYFSCRILSGDFRPSAEVTEVQWFGLDEMPYLMHAQYDMIKKIIIDLGANQHV